MLRQIAASMKAEFTVTESVAIRRNFLAGPLDLQRGHCSIDKIWCWCWCWCFFFLCVVVVVVIVVVIVVVVVAVVVPFSCSCCGHGPAR